jgi:hypothetical protein
MEEIRRLSRIALPRDDNYIFRLGTALYGFASINSFMCEIIAGLNPTHSHTTLQDMESAKILQIFRAELKNLISISKLSDIHEIMKNTADLFHDLHSERNDIMHAYPITGMTGEQILHRRRDSVGKYFEVTNEFLDNFISRLHDVSAGLYTIRTAVRGVE